MPRPHLRTYAAATIAACALASVGCFSGAGNPGYFPNYLWGGDVIHTHAKPPGGAYFRDFDPKACRLEVTPTSASARPQEQQVLVATVYDKDGNARRGRRVEWLIDGPGSIVEVDESGMVAGRGYKVDNKYAVSYTDYFDHKLTRGNGTSGDDVSIAAGQSWCVVSSAVPSETVVTCYAPEVFNWEKGKAYVKLTWSDTEFSFPPRTAGRFGGEVALNTTIKRIAEREGVSPTDLKVRYRVAGGVPADLVPPPGVSAARAGQDAIDITADADGRAPVTVVQRTPRAGQTDVAVEILKPDASGTGSTVVGRQVTAVDWSAPDLTAEVQAPKTLGLDREGTIRILVANNGKVDGSPVTVNAKLPDGFDVGRADPPADGGAGSRDLSWSLPAIPAGQKRELRVPVKANRAGSFVTLAQAASDDGLKATARGSTEAGTTKLKLTVDPAITVAVGERVPVKLSVTNGGTTPLDAVSAFVTFADGLDHDTGKGQVEVPVGAIGAGQTKSADVPLIARKPGKQWVRVNVSADGGAASDSQESTITVLRSQLTAAIAGPETILPGADAVFELRLANAGEVGVPNVTARLTVPPGLTIKRVDADGKVVGPDAATWKVGELPPGDRKTLKVSVVGDRPTEKAVLAATVLGGSDTTSAVPVRAEAAVAVVGRPALSVEVNPPRDGVTVGRRAGYSVVVRNRGTAAAKNVAVAVDVSDAYANLRGNGANREDVRPENGRLVFPPIKSLAAGASASFYVEGEAVSADDARVKAEVKADYLSEPLREEQSTRIRDKAK